MGKDLARLAQSFLIGLGTSLLIVLLHGCSATQAVQTSLNVSAAAANAAAPRVLVAQCRAELAAINHTGDYVAGHCTRSDEPRAATPEELVALARVRAAWAPVERAYEAFASAHDAARVVADQPSLTKAVEAYGLLRAAAHGVGLELPGVP